MNKHTPRIGNNRKHVSREHKNIRARITLASQRRNRRSK